MFAIVPYLRGPIVGNQILDTTNDGAIYESPVEVQQIANPLVENNPNEIYQSPAEPGLISGMTGGECNGFDKRRKTFSFTGPPTTTLEEARSLAQTACAHDMGDSLSELMVECEEACPRDKCIKDMTKIIAEADQHSTDCANIQLTCSQGYEIAWGWIVSWFRNVMLPAPAKMWRCNGSGYVEYGCPCEPRPQTRT